MADFSDIKTMIEQCRLNEAIGALDDLAAHSTDSHVLAHAFYLRGNAYRQLGNFRQALNSYLQAIELEPDGPAALAYRNVQQILDFYDHDLYNP